MARAGNGKPQNLFWSNGKDTRTTLCKPKLTGCVQRQHGSENLSMSNVFSNKCPPIQRKKKPVTAKESSGEGKVSLRHLCVKDKERVRRLILELATTGQEKYAVERKLDTEIGRFRDALIQLNQQMVSLEREKNELQNQLHGLQTEPGVCSHHRMCGTTQHPSIQPSDSLAVERPVTSDAVMCTTQSSHHVSAEAEPQLMQAESLSGHSMQSKRTPLSLPGAHHRPLEANSTNMYDSNTPLMNTALQEHIPTVPHNFTDVYSHYPNPSLLYTLHPHRPSPSPSAESWVTLPALPSEHQKDSASDSCVLSSRTHVRVCTPTCTLQQCAAPERHSTVLEGIRKSFSMAEEENCTMRPQSRSDSGDYLLDETSGEQHVWTDTDVRQNCATTRNNMMHEVGTQTVGMEDCSTQTGSAVTSPATTQEPPQRSSVETQTSSPSVELLKLRSEAMDGTDETTCVAVEAEMPVATATYINTAVDVGAVKEWECVENFESQLSDELVQAAVLLNTQEWEDGRLRVACETLSSASPPLQDKQLSLLDIAVSLNNSTPPTPTLLVPVSLTDGRHHSHLKVPLSTARVLASEHTVSDQEHLVVEDKDIIEDLFFLNVH